MCETYYRFGLLSDFDSLIDKSNVFLHKKIPLHKARNRYTQFMKLMLDNNMFGFLKRAINHT